MRAAGNVWAVVLAAGDGTRLESLTTNDRGDIVPGFADESGISRVERFVEKPDRSLARELIEADALWNAFILTGHVRTFRDLFVMRHSDIGASMQSAIARDTNRGGDARAIAEVYRQLPLIDSRDTYWRERTDFSES